MQIRLMRFSERAAVEHVYQTVHPKPDPNRDWDRLTVLVALYEGAIVGYASAQSAGSQVWLLVETLVLPEFQGHGLGKRLMEGRLALGRALGMKTAAGGCDDDHAAMRHMLNIQGFLPMPGGGQLLGRANARMYWKDLTDV